MDSGKALIQGIISRSVDNTVSQFESLGYVTANVSNYNTVSYKAQRFENYLKENGLIEGQARTDYSQGALMITKRKLDIGVEGPGFIPITRRDGLVAYTRDGSFSVDKDGYLVTRDNFIVGNGIKIPPNYHDLKIKKDGTVAIKENIDSDEKILGKIPLVYFNNPEELKTIDGNNVVATQNSGEPVYLVNHDSIHQGKLEKSNVNFNMAVDEVLRLNGSIIASMRLMKVADEFYRQSVNLRQG